MERQYIFRFKTDVSASSIPSTLNNPFGDVVPEIAKIAAEEFQEYIMANSEKWARQLPNQKGKMYGVLVVQEADHSYSYLGTVSGKLPVHASEDKFIPSIFDNSVGDYFIDKGMTELTELGKQIKNTKIQSEIISLKTIRKQKSIALQQRLFENYHFLNLSGKMKNLLEIFTWSSHGHPPSAAGECAAPKLLQYAIRHHLKPIALAEFWWQQTKEQVTPTPLVFSPACKNRCRPILEYMLEDSSLFAGR